VLRASIVAKNCLYRLSSNGMTSAELRARAAGSTKSWEFWAVTIREFIQSGATVPNAKFWLVRAESNKAQGIVNKINLTTITSKVFTRALTVIGSPVRGKNMAGCIHHQIGFSRL
jgi:hypothetical protein